jgi:hypothetical protein
MLRYLVVLCEAESSCLQPCDRWNSASGAAVRLGHQKKATRCRLRRRVLQPKLQCDAACGIWRQLV